MRICEAEPCDCVCHKLGRVSHCEHCEKVPVAEPKTVHLQAPQTSENEGANVYCPVEKEFTRIFLGRSADGMETFACGACYEPEPELKDVTDADLDVIAKQLWDNK